MPQKNDNFITLYKVGHYANLIHNNGVTQNKTYSAKSPDSPRGFFFLDGYKTTKEWRNDLAHTLFHRDFTKFSLVKIFKSLNNFLFGVHYKRTITLNRLI